MILPMRREALKIRGAMDEAEEERICAGESVSERLLMTLELSELSRALAFAVDAPWTREVFDDLADKARLYAAPLRVLVRG